MGTTVTVTVNKLKLEQLIREEIEATLKLECCVGTSLIGEIEGVQIQLVVTNNRAEFMRPEDNTSTDDNTVVRVDEWV
jgi:hypothetical protein